MWAPNVVRAWFSSAPEVRLRIGCFPIALAPKRDSSQSGTRYTMLSTYMSSSIILYYVLHITCYLPGTIRCRRHTIYYMRYAIYSSLYVRHCILYTTHDALCIVDHILDAIHYVIPDNRCCVPYAIHCTWCTLHKNRCVVQCK